VGVDAAAELALEGIGSPEELVGLSNSAIKDLTEATGIEEKKLKEWAKAPKENQEETGGTEE